MRLMSEKTRIISEGAGALSVAAALTGKAGKGRLWRLFSGGNIDLDKFCELMWVAEVTLLPVNLDQSHPASAILATDNRGCNYRPKRGENRRFEVVGGGESYRLDICFLVVSPIIIGGKTCTHFRRILPA